MTESTVPRHPVFVVGMPRSGTTLLSSLLDAHPALVVAPETHYFTRCWPGTPVQDTAHALGMLDRLFRQPGVRDMQLSEQETTTIRDAIRECSAPTHADVLRALLETYADRSSAPAWGEKTPDHLRFVPEMVQQFPEAVFVAIVRDPRDVALSLRALPWSRSTLPEQAWTWRSYAARIDRYHVDYEERFYSLRYEDLITNPEEELRGICAFLEMPFSASMLQRQEQKAQPFDAEREPWKQNSAREIDPSNRGKWRTQLPEAERALVELIVGRWLTVYRYEGPPIDWGPTLVGRILARLGGAAVRWGRRTVLNLLSGRTFRDDAEPRWVERDA